MRRGDVLAEERVRRLEVDGLAYAYRVLRQPNARTEPLVALGGVFQGMLDWPDLEAALTGVADLVTADLPGAGGADALRPHHGTGTAVRALDGVVRDLDVRRVNLYGYSYGSTLAFAFAQRHPERVARLILGGVPARISAAQRARWRTASEAWATEGPEAFATRIAELSMCVDPSRHVHRRALAYRFYRRSLLKATRTHQGRAVLDRSAHGPALLNGGLSGVATLVFSGEHDTISTPGQQRSFAATIQGSRFVTIPDSDHLVPLERPEAVISLLTAFLTDQEPAAARAVPAEAVPAEAVPAEAVPAEAVPAPPGSGPSPGPAAVCGDDDTG